MNVILLMSMLSPQAQAWNHTGWVWDREDFPKEWYMSDYIEDSLDEDYQLQVIDDSWTNWVEDAPCARLEASYMGVREGYHQGATNDGITTFSWDDPDSTIGTGTLAVTYTIPGSEVAFSLSGQSYVYAYDSDIVYNDELTWETTEDIASGQCSGGYSTEAVTTHEIGHLWGMAHSCEQNDVCNDPDERYANMYWSVGPCDNYQKDLKDDDIDGINALYGPFCSFEAVEGEERYGGAPLEVCFEVECTEAISDIEWDFGDGGSSTELEPCHTFEDRGQFNVSMTITGEGEECGTWDHTQREQAYVLVCGDPEPTEGFGGLFTYEPVDGLVYQMINQTDTSVYGCIDQIAWEIYKGGELVETVKAWSPKLDFGNEDWGGEGSYTVLLNVGGPGGVSAAELTIDAVEASEGCSTAKGAPAGAGLAGLLIGLGAALRRRRED